MDHRERVLIAINHEEPDYVPTALWGSTYGITDPLYFHLVEELNLGSPVLPFRRNKGPAINYYDDRVLEALDVDVRHVDIGFTDLGGPSRGGGKDAWGIQYEETGDLLSAIRHPLQEATLESLQVYPFPTIWKYLRIDEMVERVKFLREKTDYAIVGRAIDSDGPFERCCKLRNPSQFLADLQQNEEFAVGLIQQVTDTLCKLLEIYLIEAGPYLDIIELPGDDYVVGRPLISPRMFDRFFAPSWKRMIDMIREAAPRCKILFHADGNMEPFLSRLITLGVDIFHCLEPQSGVDMLRIKEEYGTQLSFWGAVDSKEALKNDEQYIIAEVQKRIQILGSGGGYVIAPTNHLRADVPASNVIALFKAARAFGRYPLN